MNKTSTLAELKTMYPYFRSLGAPPHKALASALTWTRYAPFIHRLRHTRPR